MQIHQRRHPLLFETSEITLEKPGPPGFCIKIQAEPDELRRNPSGPTEMLRP